MVYRKRKTSCAEIFSPKQLSRHSPCHSPGHWDSILGINGEEHDMFCVYVGISSFACSFLQLGAVGRQWKRELNSSSLIRGSVAMLPTFPSPQQVGDLQLRHVFRPIFLLLYFVSNQHIHSYLIFPRAAYAFCLKAPYLLFTHLSVSPTFSYVV